MRRIALVAALLLTGAAAAHADTDHYTNLLKQPRGDAALNVDGAYCDQVVGSTSSRNGMPVTAAYKRCMRSHGWRYDWTRVEKRRVDKTWIDPDTGDRCHDILGGLGSVCGNF
jgi:hypothetical protein